MVWRDWCKGTKRSRKATKKKGTQE